MTTSHAGDLALYVYIHLLPSTATFGPLHPRPQSRFCSQPLLSHKLARLRDIKCKTISTAAPSWDYVYNQELGNLKNVNKKE